mmetsp:Transcript_27159/g.61913  ORF Transcript_27159/g.61913 Transcript_27159/m.61913 type:complete len:206 (+) Transcript_27159:5570-6187(+)
MTAERCPLGRRAMGAPLSHGARLGQRASAFQGVLPFAADSACFLTCWTAAMAPLNAVASSGVTTVTFFVPAATAVADPTLASPPFFATSCLRVSEISSTLADCASTAATSVLYFFDDMPESSFACRLPFPPEPPPPLPPLPPPASPPSLLLFSNSCLLKDLQKSSFREESFGWWPRTPAFLRCSLCSANSFRCALVANLSRPLGM